MTTEERCNKVARAWAAACLVLLMTVFFLDMFVGVFHKPTHVFGQLVMLIGGGVYGVIIVAPVVWCTFKHTR